MEIYRHKVQYYETDQMGIVHHSNYIRWFEEARIDYMEQIGLSYVELEERGFVSPVVSVQCEYKSMTKFGQTVWIVTEVNACNAAKFSLRYTVMDSETKEVRAVGETSHCFINGAGNIISLKREEPELFGRLQKQITDGVDRKE